MSTDERLGRAVSPDLQAMAGIEPARLELWVTPPDYTGLAPSFISGLAGDVPSGPDAPITLPVGSKIVAQLHDGRGAPMLTLAGQSWPLDARDDRSWALEIVVGADMLVETGGLETEIATEIATEIEITQGGRSLGAWSVGWSDACPVGRPASP